MRWLGLLVAFGCSDTGLSRVDDPVEEPGSEKACLTASPDPLRLGSITVDASVVGTITLTGVLTIENDCGGDGPALTLLEPTLTGGDELSVSVLETTVLEDGESTELVVSWTPTEPGELSEVLYLQSDDAASVADVVVLGEVAVPDEPPESEEPLGCWYTYDPESLSDVDYDSDYPVVTHGGLNLFYYEESGGNGMQVPGSEAVDFATLRDFIFDEHTDFSSWGDETSFFSTSSARWTETAHFTYFLCDWEADDEVEDWVLETGPLDDGMLVLLNEEVAAHGLYGESLDASLDVVPGERNTLILIHVDDAEVERALTGLALYADGALFGGTD